MKRKDHLVKAMLALMRKSPFFSSIIIGLKLIEVNDENMIMATDGKRLLYNMDRLSTIKVNEIKEILTHEAMHISNKHHIRMKKCKPKYQSKIEKYDLDYTKVFNVAADLAINSILYECSDYDWEVSDLIIDGCIPGIEPYRNFPKKKSTEWYLKELITDLDDAANKSDQALRNLIDDRGLADKECSVIESSEAVDILEKDSNETLARASVMSRGTGKAGLAESYFVEQFNPPQEVNWRSELNSFIQTTTKGAPNYRRPSRRYESSDFILPSRKNKEVTDVIILVDVSGSMSNEAVSSVYDHMDTIVKSHANLNITLVPFDDEVFSDYEKVFNRSNLPVNNKNRERVSCGGTLYLPALQYAEKKKPSGIIMLTDLMPCDTVEFGDYSPRYPFLMLSVYEYLFSDYRALEKPNTFNKRVIEVKC